MEEGETDVSALSEDQEACLLWLKIGGEEKVQNNKTKQIGRAGQGLASSLGEKDFANWLVAEDSPLSL